ncbi:hypothetical protein MPDQ_004160 [Monascus purpureus]|uniref:Uncharacterized protein n=1 Tax=Monascus purpureus TaxID=5098 RepID=A0A507QHT0_MONPU|nr:hypothetical protein MPDQ_004160 [Monascus purpureus]
MATLKSNKWYQWYLREGAKGNLTLPDYKVATTCHPLNTQNKRVHARVLTLNISFALLALKSVHVTFQLTLGNPSYPKSPTPDSYRNRRPQRLRMMMNEDMPQDIALLQQKSRLA